MVVFGRPNGIVCLANELEKRRNFKWTLVISGVIKSFLLAFLEKEFFNIEISQTKSNIFGINSSV